MIKKLPPTTVRLDPTAKAVVQTHQLLHGRTADGTPIHSFSSALPVPSITADACNRNTAIRPAWFSGYTRYTPHRPRPCRLDWCATSGIRPLPRFNAKIEHETSWSSGLIISQSGFTADALRTLGSGKSVVYMEGLDLHCTKFYQLH